MARSLQRYSVWLDFFRGVAALVVFAGHARVLFLESIVRHVGLVPSSIAESHAARTASTNTSFSHEAVIVFFVLSGYLVGGSVVRCLKKNTWSTRLYAMQRLSRLWTVLIPALLLTIILDQLGQSFFGHGGIYGAPPGQELVPRDLQSRLSPFAFISNLFFLQGLIVGPIFGTDSPLWSLAYEFWFYATFPLLAFGLSNRTANPIRAVCLIVFCSIAYSLGPQFCFYYFVWLLGCMLALLPKSFDERIAERLALAIGPIFIAVCVLLVRFKPDVHISDLAVGITFTTLCYVVLHLRSPATPNVFSLGAIRLSEMSYTLYVCHVPLLVFVSAMVMEEWRPWNLTALHLAYFGMALALVFSCAYVMYLLFERNTDKVRRWLIAFSGFGTPRNQGA